MEFLFIHNSESFGFLEGLYVPLFRLNVRSKKSTTFELVSMSSLNVLMIFLRVWSICVPFTLRRISKPSSLQSPHLIFVINAAGQVGK